MPSDEDRCLWLSRGVTSLLIAQPITRLSPVLGGSMHDRSGVLAAARLLNSDARGP